MQRIVSLWRAKDYSTRWRTCIKYATKNVSTNWNQPWLQKL